MKKRKLFKKILSGSDNIRFEDFEAFGFHLERISGSHHIFKHAGIPEVLNLQSRKGKAIPYQIRQFLALMEEYNPSMKTDS